MFYLILMKSTEKLILDVYLLKKVNHFGETDCLQRNKKKSYYTVRALNHQNTTSTQVQKFIKSGRFLGGGAGQILCQR